MSAFRASTFAFRAPVARRSMGAVRSFQTFRPLAVGKESALHEEGRSDAVEKKKQEHLDKVKQGKAEWEEELASDSESMVKADRGDNRNAKEDIKTLQEETAKLSEKNKEDRLKKSS